MAQSPEVHTGASYCRSLGEIPRFIPATIRAVRNARAVFTGEKTAELKEVIVRVTHRVIRAPSISSVLCEAAEELYPIHLADYPELPLDQLSRFFTAEELNALLASLFLVRRLSSKCPGEEWTQLLGRMRTHTALGRIAGEMIPSVGGGNGMLIAALRYASLGVFLATVPDKFKRYDQASRQGKTLFETERESQLFGISHLEVAGELALQLGFGAIIASLFVPHSAVHATGKSELKNWIKAQRLTEAFHTSGSEAVQSVMNYGVNLSPELVTHYTDAIESVLSNPACSQWMLVATGQLSNEDGELAQD